MPRDAINAKKEALAKQLKKDIAETQSDWEKHWLPLQKHNEGDSVAKVEHDKNCLLYTSPSPRDRG